MFCVACVLTEACSEVEPLCIAQPPEHEQKEPRADSVRANPQNRGGHHPSALEDTTCYRLDRDAFYEIVKQRPEIAENASRIMAQRLVDLEAARENLDSEVRERRMRATQSDLMARIREFFGLDSGG